MSWSKVLVLKDAFETDAYFENGEPYSAKYISANQEKFDADLDIIGSFPDIFAEIMNLTKWTRKWHPISFSKAPLTLPPDCEQFLVNLGLPHVVEIQCYNDITLSFSGKITKLSDIWQRDTDKGMMLGVMPQARSCLFILNHSLISSPRSTSHQ